MAAASLVAALAAAVVLVGGLVWPGWFITRVFDRTTMQDGVAAVLTDAYGRRDVGPVSCPAAVPVVAGTALTCTVDLDGTPVPVRVTVADADGTYQVDRPDDG